jgi:sporulation protein YlmC with PRC-barrel domain
LNASELEGKDVIGLNGWRIGKVKEAIVDLNQWRITHLDVALQGNIAEELGMTHVPVLKTNHIPIEVKHVQGVADAITLNTTKEDLLKRLMEGDLPQGTATN